MDYGYGTILAFEGQTVESKLDASSAPGATAGSSLVVLNV